MKLSLRVSNDCFNALREIARAYNVDVSTVLRCLIENGLEILKHDVNKLNVNIRLKILNALLDEYRRREEQAYKAYKSVLRSNEYLVKDKDYQVLDDGTVKKKGRYERLLEMVERDGETREDIESLLNLRRFYAEKIKETARTMKKLLQELGHYKKFEELEQ